MYQLDTWDKELSTDETNSLCCRVASVHLSRIIDTDLFLQLASWVKDIGVSPYLTSKAIEKVCAMKVSYDEISVSDAINVRQIQALFQKRADIEIHGIDKTEIAESTFVEGERLCARTNEIFRLRAQGLFSLLPDVEARLFRAQRKIAQILGPVPCREDIKPRFGPGATTTVVKKWASPREKLGGRLACSEEFLAVIRDHLNEDLLGWFFSSDDEEPATRLVDVDVHPGKLVFVPKSWKTHRSVVVEPVLNSMFQLGIGDYISKRLSKAGINLRDQTLNQRLARVGSLTGALATLDLSSASDTIAEGLVYDLLPLDWAIWLGHYRTGSVSYKGQCVRLQKFSSMGNGFTFPLESLIFYALAYACADEGDTVSVYGDDIIVPSHVAGHLMELLRVTGFIPNPDKSFSSGPFRESCGADYLKGIDIRPSYLKDSASLGELFVLHNAYFRRQDEEVCRIILDYIHPTVRKYGPDGYGDGHLLGDFTLSPHGRKRGWGGFTFETYTNRSRKSVKTLPGDRVLPTYSTYSSEDSPARGLLSTSRDFSASGVAALARSLSELTLSGNSVHASYDKFGRLVTTLPGHKGVNLIKIYTLTPHVR